MKHFAKTIKPATKYTSQFIIIFLVKVPEFKICVYFYNIILDSDHMRIELAMI